MSFICERELTEIYNKVEKNLQQYGLETEMDIMRDYMLKIKIIENDKPLGKLIIDYSPKRNAHGFRRDSDLSQNDFERILNILNAENLPKPSDNNSYPKIRQDSPEKVSGNLFEDYSKTEYHAYVDGSFIDGHVGYGAVILKNGEVVKEIYGRVKSEDALSARQVGGEIQAVIEALKWCEKNNINEIAIFYDFLNIERWATGEYRTNTPITMAYKEFIDKCKVKITWVKVESHTGIELNDRADELAKMGARGSADTVNEKDTQKSHYKEESIINDKPDTVEQISLFDNPAKEMLKGWIIYNGSLMTPKFMEHVEWFVDSAKNNGIELIPVRNDELGAVIINGKTNLTGYDETQKPDFVLFWDKDIRLARHLESMGFRLFNNSNAIMVCDDKIATHQALANQGIKMPVTIASPFVYSGTKVDEENFIEKIEQVLSYPVIVKNAFGSFGAQVYMARNREELLMLRKKLIDVPHLYQEYIKSSFGRDVRLQVVGDKVVAAMLRVNENDFRANVTAGGRMMPFDPPKAFCDMAVKAAKLVGADFAGVDILFGENDEPVLCEINSNAHVKNMYECTKKDIPDYIIKYIKCRLVRSI